MIITHTCHHYHTQLQLCIQFSSHFEYTWACLCVTVAMCNVINITYSINNKNTINIISINNKIIK